MKTGIIFLALSVTSCSAYDLGSETAPEIAVDADNPTWDGGVANIIDERCASCHSNLGANFVPANTPESYEQMDQKSFYDDKDNLDKIRNIRFRMLSTEDPMPPNFASPLYENELNALEKFFSDKINELSQ
jgi:hypothetical protein